MNVLRFMSPASDLAADDPSGVSAPATSGVLALAAVAAGRRVRIVEVLGGRHLLRRLADLGLRVGSEVEVINRRGGGVILRCRGQAVALGGGVARKVLVAVLDA